MINPKEYVPAALAVIATQGQIGLTGAFTSSQIGKFFNQFLQVNVPDEIIEPSMDYAVAIGLAKRFDDPFTPPHFMMDNSELVGFITSSNNSDSAFTKAKILGAGWMTLALQGLVNRGLSEFIGDGEAIPASDRIVTIDHNQRTQFDSQIEEIATSIEKSNSIRDELGDDADRIVAELTAGRALLKVDTARISALIAVLLKPLRYLSDKFADGAIGALAAALVIELLKLI